MRTIGDELLSRLGLLAKAPKVIVDVGCALGEMSTALEARYPEATVLALDCDAGLLEASSATHRLQADAAALPLASGSVDWVIAHGLLPWVETWAPVIEEWRRVLRPGGVLMLTTFGPDTLRECTPRVNTPWPVRIDMHDLGDSLIQAGFEEPVLDVRHFTVRYQSLEKLETDLAGMGLAGLMVLSSVSSVSSAAESGAFNVIFECIFGLCFLGEGARERVGEVSVSLAGLRASLRNRDGREFS